MSKDESTLTASVVAAFAVLGGVVFANVSQHLGVAFAVPVGLVSVICGAVVLRGPLGSAIARRLEGSSGVDPAAVDQVVAPLEAEVDGLKARLAEVEERLDFAERVLTQADQPERLPGRGPQ
ncbi:MAG TPA: hypothetical protein VFW66_05680 [Gemmatimonadales bacterium]|nr:hypothetical protein [Gemmatimonadales bacterium]